MNYNTLEPGRAKKPGWLSVYSGQLRLLIWKNYKLQTRSFIMTLLEILVPVSSFNFQLY